MDTNRWCENKENLKKIRIDESSPEDISSYVIEMHERINNLNIDTDEDIALHRDFINIMENNPNYHGEFRAKVSSFFLRKNKFLLEVKYLTSLKPFYNKRSIYIKHALFLPNFFINKTFFKKIKILFDSATKLNKYYCLKLLHKFFVFLFVPPCIPFIIFIRILSPIYRINIGLILSERMGHLAGNTYIYAINKIHGIHNPASLDLFAYNYPVANKSLLRVIGRSLNLLPPIIGYSLYNANKLLPFSSLNSLFSNPYSDRDLYNLLDITPPQFPLTTIENLNGQSFLASHGIKPNDRIVCLNVRDDGFLKRFLPWWDWSYHDYRNCSISNYKEAAITLANLGYFVFRMGASVNEKFDVNHPRIFDYATNGMRTDFLDVFLGSTCTFAISNGTGFDALPYIYKRPILYVDHVPLSILNTFSSNFLLTTKRVWSQNLNRYLTFYEIFKIGIANEFRGGPALHDANLSYVESSQEEINEYVIEMHERINNLTTETKDDIDLQKKFWSLYDREAQLHGTIKAHFSTSFLRRNKALLD